MSNSREHVDAVLDAFSNPDFLMMFRDAVVKLADRKKAKDMALYILQNLKEKYPNENVATITLSLALAILGIMASVGDKDIWRFLAYY
jgi:hypothetical protein